MFSTRNPGDLGNQASIVAQSLSSGERRTLVENAVEPRLVGSGHLAFARDGSLFAVSLDLDRVEVTGGVVPMVEGVSMAPTGGAYYDLSDRGDLVFASGGQSAEERRIAWLDMDGNAELLPLPAQPFDGLALADDGDRIAVAIESDSSSRIDIVDIARGTSQTLTPSDMGNLRTPQWSPDGRWVYFTDGLAVYRARSDFSGAVETLTDGLANARLGSLSRDGRRAALYTQGGEGRIVSLLDLESGTTEEVLRGVGAAELSPDGRLIAYETWEQTTFRTYVVDLETGRRVVASSAEGADPAWSPDGRRLYFSHYPSQNVEVVEVIREPELAIGEQRTLFRHPAFRDNEVIAAPDGRRFLTLVPPNVSSADPAAPENRIRIHVITGWADEVARRVKPR